MASKLIVGSRVEYLKEKDVFKRYVFVGADNPIIIIRVRDRRCIQLSMSTYYWGVNNDSRRRYSKSLLLFCQSTSDILSYETVHRICTVWPIT